jgi:hypothetical protein
MIKYSQRKQYLKLLPIFLLLLSACSERNNEYPGNSEDESNYFNVQEGEKIYNRNPYLTDEYLENRKVNENYTYFIIDTLHIKNAVKLSYKKEWLQIDMITSEKELHQLDIEILNPWELLSRDHFYLQGMGGPQHPFLSDYNLRGFPYDDYDRVSFDLYQNYAVFPLEQEKFLFVIIDEATYMLTEAYEGITAPITAHTIGLPFKMLYSLEED